MAHNFILKIKLSQKQEKGKEGRQHDDNESWIAIEHIYLFNYSLKILQ
jgi:hypothetical protein